MTAVFHFCLPEKEREQTGISILAAGACRPWRVGLTNDFVSPINTVWCRHRVPFGFFLGGSSCQPVHGTRDRLVTIPEPVNLLIECVFDTVSANPLLGDRGFAFSSVRWTCLSSPPVFLPARNYSRLLNDRRSASSRSGSSSSRSPTPRRPHRLVHGLPHWMHRATYRSTRAVLPVSSTHFGHWAAFGSPCLARDGPVGFWCKRLCGGDFSSSCLRRLTWCPTVWRCHRTRAPCACSGRDSVGVQT